MEYMGVFILIGVCVVLIYISVMSWTGKKFAEIVESKGYERGNWAGLCFWLGLPAWLIIIALPNKKQHEELLAALQNKQGDESNSLETNDNLQNDNK